MNQLNFFECDCTDGWTGERCDDVDEAYVYTPPTACSSVTCFNRGTCVNDAYQSVCLCDDINEFSCYCPPENSRDVFGAACICKDGWIGEQCDWTPCGSGCQNGATCEDVAPVGLAGSGFGPPVTSAYCREGRRREGDYTTNYYKCTYCILGQVVSFTS